MPGSWRSDSAGTWDRLGPVSRMLDLLRRMPDLYIGLSIGVGLFETLWKSDGAICGS